VPPGLRYCIAAALALVAATALAAPDEDKLGKASGYPVGAAVNWFFDESVRVGSFTHQAEIPGLYRGKVNVLQPAATPMPLRSASREPDYRWSVGNAHDLTVDDFLARQRIMGLLIVKDGVIEVERYQYDRTPAQRFVSHSMAKSITSLAVGFALDEGRIASLDDRADKYAPGLRGTLYGETTIRNLLRMASGARFVERYDGTGDNPRFTTAIVREGIEGAARIITERETEQGARFNYSGPHTVALAAVVRGTTGMSLSDYLTPRLWQAIGAETSALWIADRTGLEVGLGNFNATLRDYARLGIVLANDGVRPDDPSGKQIIPRDYLIGATDWKRQPEAFQPGKATPFFGYGYQFWLYPGASRRFVMLGVYGQSVFVDPALKLVIVQTAANATAEAGETSLARDRDAFWRGVMRYYAK
jgi:CubicO group peptidase (beta-lactamase class C family)